MSMAPGFTATCLLELPDCAPVVDLYFPMGPKNARKLVRVHSAGSELNATRRSQMLSRGVRLLWIKTSDEQTYLNSLAGSRITASQLAHCLLDACLSAEDLSTYEASAKASLEIVCRWINMRANSGESDSTLSPIWHELSQITLLHDFTTHAGRVATFAVLFAMAFDHIDPTFLSDLAIAGFLHDLGKLKLGMELASSSSKKLLHAPKAVREHYESHSEESVQLLSRFCPQVSERVRHWIHQHHERFGGGGYPLGLEGYKVDDISQLLAAADLLDELSSGRWDDRCRGLRGAFEALETFDQQQTFPQYFNPDLLKALLSWSNRTKTAVKAA